MSIDIQSLSLQEQFEEVIREDNKLRIQDFLNSQNISDVADLIRDNEDYAAQIISSLAVHRAAGTFKILDLSSQKDIILNLPPLKTAELLNELPSDDRTAFPGRIAQ